MIGIKMKKSLVIILLIILTGCQNFQETPQATQTPWIITATPLPTSTLIPSPSPTSTSVVSLLGNDPIFVEVSEVSLYLPSNFQIATKDNIEAMLDLVENLGGNFTDIARVVRENPDKYLLVAYDLTSSYGKSITIIKMQDQYFSFLTADSFIQSLKDSYEEMGVSIEQKSACKKEGFDCMSFRSILTIEGISVSSHTYVLLQNNILYAIDFSVVTEKYKDNYPVFQAIFESLNIE